MLGNFYLELHFKAKVQPKSIKHTIMLDKQSRSGPDKCKKTPQGTVYLNRPRPLF